MGPGRTLTVWTAAEAEGIDDWKIICVLDEKSSMRELEPVGSSVLGESGMADRLCTASIGP